MVSGDHHILKSTEKPNLSVFSDSEKEILEFVAQIAHKDGGQKLLKVSHEEKAFKKTEPLQLISTITGEGLAEALKGTQVVFDVANSPSFEDKAVLEFFETSGRNLLSAEKVAGVRHHIALSVVGIDRLPASGYFRAKVAQEKLIKASNVPFTIVQSTQFFEFLAGIAQAGTVGQTVHMSPAFMQPIASEDVATQLAEIPLSTPLNDTIEIAGPERVRLSELVQRYLIATNDSRKVIADVQAPYFGAVLAVNTLLPGKNPRLGSIDFESWFESQTRKV